jgi:hypothetical protein
MTKTYRATNNGIQVPHFYLSLKIGSQSFATAKCAGGLAREWPEVGANDNIVGQKQYSYNNDSNLVQPGHDLNTILT